MHESFNQVANSVEMALMLFLNFLKRSFWLLCLSKLLMALVGFKIKHSQYFSFAQSSRLIFSSYTKSWIWILWLFLLMVKDQVCLAVFPNLFARIPLLIIIPFISVIYLVSTKHVLPMSQGIFRVGRLFGVPLYLKIL